MIDSNIILNNLLNSDSINFTYKVRDTSVVQKYTVTYASNLEEGFSQYYVNYTSNYLTEEVSSYLIAYDSIYGDVVQSYRIRYHSGRDLTDSTSRYYVRYLSSFTNDNLLMYKIRFTTTGTSSNNHRIRYKVRYDSNSALETKTTYKVKYSTSTFYENSTKYTMKYTTTGAESILVDAILLRHDDSTDALFQIRSVKDEILDPYLFVLSNMPKYQTVEFRVGESLPYIQYLTYEQVSELDMFDLDGSTAYTVKGYLLIKDVEDLNGLSLDLYNVEDNYRKVNKAKTYFFGVSPDDYQETFLSLNGTTYYYLNKTSNDYNVKNLNYVGTSVTPTFRFGIDCCFSRKINKTNYSYCSPF